MFEEADEATLRLCATYTAAKSALELKAEQARRELAAARTMQAQLEAERARLRRGLRQSGRAEDDAVRRWTYRWGGWRKRAVWRPSWRSPGSASPGRRTGESALRRHRGGDDIVAFGAYPDGWPLRDAIRAGWWAPACCWWC